MRIQNIQNYYSLKNNNQPGFKSWDRIVYDRNGKILHCNKTSVCREPDGIRVKDFWGKFVNYLLEKYKNVPKVNVYSFGCSDGSEMVTLAGGLKALGGEEFSKFTPFLAFDIDPVAINRAESGQIELKYNEAKIFNQLTKGQFGRFLYTTEPNAEPFDRSFLIKPEYKPNYNMLFSTYTDENIKFNIAPEIAENIEYKVGDVMKEVDNIEPDNTVVSAANLWFYLGKKRVSELAKALYERLGENSCVRVGAFDDSINIDKVLTNAGFVMSKIPYIYEKPSKQALEQGFQVLV